MRSGRNVSYRSIFTFTIIACAHVCACVCVFVCMWLKKCHSMHAEIRGQRGVVDSLFPPCGSIYQTQVTKLDSKVPLPAEPPQQSSVKLYCVCEYTRVHVSAHERTCRCGGQKPNTGVFIICSTLFFQTWPLVKTRATR